MLRNIQPGGLTLGNFTTMKAKSLSKCHDSHLKRFALLLSKGKVSGLGTCLRVFCDETISALKVHPETQDASGTIYLLIFVLELWKIVNVHSKFTAQKHLIT